MTEAAERTDRPNKVVLITGASAGLGASLAREAARRGYALVLTARRLDRLDALAEELRQTGTEVETVAEAIESPGAPDRIVEAAVARFGRLDVLINNAGLGLPTLYGESDADSLRLQVDVNLTAPLILTARALPYLIASRGIVINIGSSITCVENPALGAYGATKAGLAYWSTALRRELKFRGVRVCLVEPGPFKTEFFEAVSRLAEHPGAIHPLHSSPAAWMSAEVDDVARRVVNLVERPRRRVSVLRRIVWPWRVVGGLFRLWPWLGDLAVASSIRYAGEGEGVGRARVKV